MSRYTAKTPAFDTVILDGSVFQDLKQKADAYPSVVAYLRELVRVNKDGNDPYTWFRLAEILLKDLGEL